MRVRRVHYYDALRYTYDDEELLNHEEIFKFVDPLAAYKTKADAILIPALGHGCYLSVGEWVLRGEDNRFTIVSDEEFRREFTPCA